MSGTGKDPWADLLHEQVDILLGRAEAGLVVHRALHELALHIQVLELPLKLLHGGGDLLQVVGSQCLHSHTCFRQLLGWVRPIESSGSL